MKNKEQGNNIPAPRTCGYDVEPCATNIIGALHLEFSIRFVALNPPAAVPRNTLSGIRQICRTGNKPLWMMVHRTLTLNGNTAQLVPAGREDTAQVLELLIHLDGEMIREEIQHKLKLTHRENFRKSYLKPSLDAGLIEMTLPDKPNSRYQKYRLNGKRKKNETKSKNIK